MENLEKTLLNYYTKTYVTEVLENVTYIRLDEYINYRGKFVMIYEEEVTEVDKWVENAKDGSSFDDMIIVEENGIKYIVCLCLQEACII